MTNLDAIRHAYATSTPGDWTQNAAEFDAALAEHDRQEREAAWDEGNDCPNRHIWTVENPYWKNPS